MLLGFISLLLTASSRIISNICIDSKFYNGRFSPCTVAEVETESSSEDEDPEKRKNNYTEGTDAIVHLSVRRLLSTLNYHSCKEACILSNFLFSNHLNTTIIPILSNHRVSSHLSHMKVWSSFTGSSLSWPLLMCLIAV